jgi:hypothetical protein
MKKLIFILAVFWTASCSPDRKLPDGIIPQQQMRLIIWDLIRADEYINNFVAQSNKADLKTERLILYEQIFKLHHVNQQQFRKSLAFYQSRPDLFKVIADSLRQDERRVLDEQSRIRKPLVDTGVGK